MKNQSFVGKWGEQTSDLGWTAVPIALLFLQGKLKISPIEMNVLINLLMHWWKLDQLPYPSQDAIAYRIGVSKRTIQRAVVKLLDEMSMELRNDLEKHSRFKKMILMGEDKAK